MDTTENCRFRSDFYHDLKLHQEFNRGTRDTRLFFRFVYLYIIAIFIWCFWYMVIHMEMPGIYANTALFICGIWVMVEVIWFFMARGGGVHYKRSLMLNGGQPTNDAVLFCDDHIITLEQETGNKATILYENIRAVTETEHLLLLALRHSTYLMVDKRGLSCTKEDLGQFLYEKCPRLRNKKVRTSKWGIILRRIVWAVVGITFLLSLYFHPWLQIDKCIRGQIHNGMSLTKIAEELKTYGIGSLSDEELENADTGLFFLSGSKLEHLLYVLGAGDRDYDTGSFIPAETGVFFSYYWAEYPEAMYDDFLRGVAAMSRGEIVIDNIQEDHSNADWTGYDGTITVDFTLNGKEQTMEAVFYREWYDEQCFNTLNAMIKEATGKQLYFVDFEDTACFIFLGDESWAQSFEKRTGLEISSDINDIY